MQNYTISNILLQEPALDPPQETINPERKGCPAQSMEMTRNGVWVVAKNQKGILAGYLIPFENIRHIEFDISKKDVTEKVTPLKRAA